MTNAASKGPNLNVKLWLPPLSSKDQEKLDRLRKKRIKAKQRLLTGIKISAAILGSVTILFVFIKFWWPEWLIIPTDLLFLLLLFSRIFTAKWTGFPGKTLWDWLQLLGVVAVPIAVGILGATFSNAIAQQQTIASIQIAHEQEQETALQQYLDYMSGLLTNKDIEDPIKGAQLRVGARARTVIALATLDPTRKGIALQFLIQSNFINRTNPIVDLHRVNITDIRLIRADLRSINLSGVNLNYADLSGDFLNNTNLSGAFLFADNLSGVEFNGADLSKANLKEAYLGCTYLNGKVTCADLRGSNLYGADLSFSDLHGAYITQQQLDQVYSCKDAFLPQGLTCHRNQSPP